MPQTDSSYETFIMQYNERKQRESNLMVYNIPESTESEDLTKIKETFAQFHDVVIKKVFRLGKQVNGRRPRPIKEAMDNPSAALEILRNKNKLPLDQVKVGPDLTIKQREHPNELRRDLLQRTEKGEQDLTIKYVNGVPMIVKKN
ncbi:hypothetical protein JTB14_016739 [Gonioctena quinquepunctata]|nr:hypothetical protein JTB14_016739 [Gonioctena quinquepunctata]